MKLSDVLVFAAESMTIIALISLWLKKRRLLFFLSLFTSGTMLLSYMENRTMEDAFWILCLTGWIYTYGIFFITFKRKARQFISSTILCTLCLYLILDSDPAGFLTDRLFSKMRVGYSLEDSIETAYGDDLTIENNMDTLVFLDEEEWAKLDLSQRLDVLRCVSRIEGNKLGLFNEVEIEAAELPENIAGTYNHSKSLIRISVDFLMEDDAHENLDTLCHEMFHAAEYCFVEIYESLDPMMRRSYFMTPAHVYKSEFCAYRSRKNGDEYVSYYRQKVEADARLYARESVRTYYIEINEYLNTHGF